MGEAEMKICESTRKSNQVRTKEWSVLITEDMNGSCQTGKCCGMSCYIMIRSLVQEDGNKDVTCFLLLSHQKGEDTQKEESWTTDSNLAAGDF